MDCSLKLVRQAKGSLWENVVDKSAKRWRMPMNNEVERAIKSRLISLLVTHGWTRKTNFEMWYTCHQLMTRSKNWALTVLLARDSEQDIPSTAWVQLCYRPCFILLNQGTGIFNEGLAWTASSSERPRPSWAEHTSEIDFAVPVLLEIIHKCPTPVILIED